MSDANPDHPSVTVKRVGQSQQPVVVIDDFHPEPDRLKAFAATLQFGQLSPYYPGLQAEMDPRHLQPVERVFLPILKEVFGLTSGLGIAQCTYSLVTVPDAQLQPIQRLPHVDTTDARRIALLHFLCPREAGGTAFYRHRATGLEVLDEAAFAAYSKAVEKEGMPKPGYMRGPDDRFEMIGHIEAKPNRAILYRSQLLHSGFIPEDLTFSDDPQTGRLTLNTFFQGRG